MQRLVGASIGLAVAGLLALLPAAAGAQDPTFTDTFEIELSDGTRIHACRIAPSPQDELTLHPVVLEWTNYNIDSEATGPAGGCPPQFGALAADLVTDGYVFVAAQTRGVGASSGQPDIWSSQDGRDGAEVVEWLAAQPWTTGAIGLVGCSSSAMEGMQVAVEAPPSLAAISMGCFAVDSYRGAFYPGGLRAYTAFVFAARLAPDVEPIAAIDLVSGGNTSPLLRPVTDAIVAAEATTTTEDGPFWRDKSTADRLDRITAPMYAFANWADYFGRGATEWARDHLGPDDRLLITPGWHGASAALPGPYGMNARTKAWFDHHLRGRPLPFAHEDPVLSWELEGGFDPSDDPAQQTDRFISDTTWPPRDVTWQRWHLADGPSGTSTSTNDGALSLSPVASEGSASYPYPVPNVGGTTDPRAFGQPSFNTAELEDAGGALTFTSDPLPEPLHLAGPIAATLYVSSTAPDTDVIVRLLSVAPDGSFQDITNGWLKAEHRALDDLRTLRNTAGDIIRPYHPHDVAVPMPIGQVERLDIELWPTATEVPAGYRLRVFVTAQEAPWFLQDTPPSFNTLTWSPHEPSSILLPIRSETAAESEPDPAPASSLTGPSLPATGGSAVLVGAGFLLTGVVLRRR